MEIQADTKKRIANLTSNILNPFLLTLVIIVLVSSASATSAMDALKWSSIAVAMGVMPVVIGVIYLLKQGKLDEIFISVREQRTKIYILGTFSASVGCAALVFMNAPEILVAVFATGLSTAIIFTLINLWWKISIHTALMAASATIMVLLYGWIAAAVVALVPLTAWARIELEYHSLAQAVSGALLATALVMALFYPMAF